MSSELDDCGDNSDELDCAQNCNFYLASSGDVVESPYYPHKYAPLTNCKWTLEGPQGHNILLQFQEFETEKIFDTVQILVGGKHSPENAIWRNHVSQFSCRPH